MASRSTRGPASSPAASTRAATARPRVTDLFDFLVEQKLSEAVSRGELDNLPGAGRPLALDDDPLVPEDLRLAYRILKNAGYAPAEVKKPGLLRLRIEARYYGKVVRKLGRR